MAIPVVWTRSSYRTALGNIGPIILIVPWRVFSTLAEVSYRAKLDTANLKLVHECCAVIGVLTRMIYHTSEDKNTGLIHESMNYQNFICSHFADSGSGSSSENSKGCSLFPDTEAWLRDPYTWHLINWDKSNLASFHIQEFPIFPLPLGFRAYWKILYTFFPKNVHKVVCFWHQIFWVVHHSCVGCTLTQRLKVIFTGFPTP